VYLLTKRPDKYGFADDGYFASNGKCGEAYVVVSRQLTDVGRFFYENDYTTTDWDTLCMLIGVSEGTDVLQERGAKVYMDDLLYSQAELQASGYAVFGHEDERSEREEQRSISMMGGQN
jgi:hypothetical protein